MNEKTLLQHVHRTGDSPTRGKTHPLTRDFFTVYEKDGVKRIRYRGHSAVIPDEDGRPFEGSIMCSSGDAPLNEVLLKGAECWFCDMAILKPSGGQFTYPLKEFVREIKGFFDGYPGTEVCRQDIVPDIPCGDYWCAIKKPAQSGDFDHIRTDYKGTSESKPLKNLDTADAWIIAVCNSEADGIVLSKAFGREETIKKVLIGMLLEDKENDPDVYENGTESLNDIKKEHGYLNAYATYANYHIDYTAMMVIDIKNVADSV